MRRFLSLRYVMTSNGTFEKNKMASTLAASVSLHGLFTKCKEAERRVKFKGNRKRCREETEKTRKCVYETLCPQPYACPEKRFKSERSATQTIKKLISSSTP